ncbi:unnamed protein product [Urochloa humidicola]
MDENTGLYSSSTFQVIKCIQQITHLCEATVLVLRLQLTLTVTLYVMLVGAYSFEDPYEPQKFRKTIQMIHQVCSTNFHTMSAYYQCAISYFHDFFANQTNDHLL